MKLGFVDLQDEIIWCNICNRPVLNHEIDFETGIAYCYGCHHYFPLKLKSKKSRDEIVIPHKTDFIRLRIMRDELEIRIKWSRNFQFWKSLNNGSGGFHGLFTILATLLNRTTIEVRSGYIKIDHTPIDLLPMTFYSSRIIKQFKVEPLGFSSEPHDSHGLYVLLTSGQKVLLLWDLKKTTLLFIEQEMERVLKIVDTE